MAGVRRSGRIPKQLPILLLGTDTSGRVFSEESHTLVLSRHGAGIVARNKFAPDEVLTLRLLESGREAEIRLVGKLGEHPRGNVYGVAFCDADLDFWQIEFPPAPDYAPSRSFVDLECCFCGDQTSTQQSEIECDVFLASQLVLRYCQTCGQTTSWRLASKKVSAPAGPAIDPLPSQEAPRSPTFAPASFDAPFEPKRSAYASATMLPEIVSTRSFELTPVAAEVIAPSAASRPRSASAAVAVEPPLHSSNSLPPPAFSGGGKANRRRHVRTRVQFTACVRMNHSNEEIVECDNISKGGLCFRSRKHYEENATIEVAVPYSPGQPAIFTSARIRRIEELPGLNLFRYGVAYA